MIIDKLSFAAFSPKDFSFIRLEKISIFFSLKTFHLRVTAAIVRLKGQG